MQTKVSIKTMYHCTLEKAFKSPILCDITKVHTGNLFSPKIIAVSDDQDWGKQHSTKKLIAAATLFNKAGYFAIDKIIERKENQYWKIEVYNFQNWQFGFYKFEGEWKTTEVSPNQIQINYSYILHSNILLLYPIQWLFTKIFWRKYMQQVIENIKKLIEMDEIYLYE